MKKTVAHFSTRAIITCGLMALGSQVSALAGDINLTLSPDPLAAITHDSASLTIKVDATADGSGDAEGVTVSFQVPKGLSVSVPTNCAVTKAKGDSTVVCSLGNITEGSSATVTVDFSANKADSWGLDVLSDCSTFCTGSKQNGILITFSH